MKCLKYRIIKLMKLKNLIDSFNIKNEKFIDENYNANLR